MTIVEKVERRMEICKELMHLRLNLTIALGHPAIWMKCVVPLRDKIAALEKEWEELKS